MLDAESDDYQDELPRPRMEKRYRSRELLESGVRRVLVEVSDLRRSAHERRLSEVVRACDDAEHELRRVLGV